VVDFYANHEPHPSPKFYRVEKPRNLVSIFYLKVAFEPFSFQNRATQRKSETVNVENRSKVYV